MSCLRFVNRPGLSCGGRRKDLCADTRRTRAEGAGKSARQAGFFELSTPLSVALRRDVLARHPFERVVVVEHENDDHRREAGRGERQQPTGVPAGRILDLTHRIRAGEARQVADRIDQGDAACCGRSGEEGRRQRPEHGRAAEDAEARDRQRHHLHRRVIERGGNGDPGGATSSGNARWNRRSILRSERRPHSTMPIRPTSYGSAERDRSRRSTSRTPSRSAEGRSASP